jgi:hypothetical protein
VKLFLRLSVLLAVASGCNTALRADPEGLRCDPGGVCPPGYACQNNVCRGTGQNDGGACTAQDCNVPPASQCQDANTRRTFTAGSCNTLTGQCVWTAQDTTCAMGCAAGVCIGDPCNSISCTTPPAATCLNSTTLRVFGNAGTCSGGTCSYPTTDTTCTNGCVNGACVNQNLCNGVTCNMPPAPSCSGANRITYASPGTCNPGTGQCSYTQNSTNCPGGCTNGACNTAALNFLQTHPQVRHRVDSLDQAPNRAGDRVLAVGPTGAISFFNGTTWTRVSSNGIANDLTGVWYSGANSAWIVGKNRTVMRWNGAAVTSVNTVPGSGSSNFVAVHGTADNDVVLADETGNWWRFRSGTWTTGSVPGGGQTPYAMRAVYVDPGSRARIAGRCAAGTVNAKGCVFYNSADGGTWFEDLDNSATTTDGFLSVGPTPAAIPTNEAWVGTLPTTAMKRHEGVNGTYDSTGVPTLPSGYGVVGITGTGASAVSRATFILTGRDTTNASSLFRATAVGLDASGALFDFYFNQQTLSRTESGGVLVADTRTTQNVNTIVRRGPLTNEALDLGEDWVGFDSNQFPVGAASAIVPAYVVLSPYNDIGIRPIVAPGAPDKHVWTFRRGPLAETTDVVAGSGFAGITGRLGALYRFSIALGFTKVTLSNASTADLNAICRATDTELYAVGNGGAIFQWAGGVNATAMTSNTTANLNDVHCPTAGSAVACGASGTVLVYRNSAWAAVSPAFPNASATLTSCRQVGGAIFVAGDGVFARFEAGAWTNLASRPQLSDLVPLSSTDVYASSGAEVVRFDGTSWTSRFTAPQVLRAGGQVGARVVYAGGAGVVVESQ